MKKAQLISNHPKKNLIGMNKVLIYSFILVLQFTLLTSNSFGWGSGHRWITESAIEVLPEWQQKIIGTERKQLERRYSLYPDFYNSNKKEISPYIMPALRKGMESARTTLHMDTTPELNLELFNFYVKRILKDLKNPKTHIEGIRFMGTFCHSIQDRVCPAHSFPEDIYWDDMKQFLPQPGSKYIWLHSKLEDFNVNCRITGYKPKLLGTNAKEIIEVLNAELAKMKSFARSRVIPLIEAIYTENNKKRNNLQLEVAYKASEITADFIYTMLCLSSNHPRNVSEFKKASKKANLIQNKATAKADIRDIEFKQILKQYRALFSRFDGNANIVAAALQSIPPQQKKILNRKNQKLIEKYSELTDGVKVLIKAKKTLSKTLSKYDGASLVLPISQEDDLKILSDSITLALDYFKNDKPADACKIIGVLSAFIVSRNSPVNLYKRNLYCLHFQDFIPAPDAKKQIWNKGQFFDDCQPFEITGYQPQLLGESADEIAFRLQIKLSTSSLLKARKGFIAFLRALYNDNQKVVKQYQQQCADNAARDIADMLYSLCVLASNEKAHGLERKPFKSISLLDIPQLNNYNPNRRWAARMTHHFLQMHWHRPNYYGRLIKNTAGGFPYPAKKQRPLSLKMKNGKEVSKGFVQNSDYGHIFLIPAGVFSHFEATIGQQSGMENDAEYCFIIKSKGQELYKSNIVKKNGEPVKISVPLKKNIDKISLHVQKTDRKSSSRIHAVWGNPVLVK